VWLTASVCRGLTVDTERLLERHDDRPSPENSTAKKNE